MSSQSDICAIIQSSGETGYQVELRVNGVAVPGRVLERQHLVSSRDRASHSGAVRKFLNSGDKISLWIVPLADANGNRRKFKVPANLAAMMVTRVRQFD